MKDGHVEYRKKNDVTKDQEIKFTSINISHSQLFANHLTGFNIQKCNQGIPVLSKNSHIKQKDSKTD